MKPVLALTLATLLAIGGTGTCGAADAASNLSPFRPPTELQIPAGELGRTIRYGEQIVSETSVYAKGHVGNGLSCENCHLDIGRRANAAPFVGVYAAYPQYQARSAQVVTLEDRINDCFLRSMNGKPLKSDSHEMRALVSYMAWLSTGVPVGSRVVGHGLPKLEALSADRARGAKVYASNCAACHGLTGQGQASFPPLWGPRSFNIGAGMARLDTLASFIEANMPLGRPGTLGHQQAYDVAAFVLGHPRPDFKAKVHDWPKGHKPKDTPY